MDEANLTCRVTDAIAPIAKERGIAMDVVLGPGFDHSDELDRTLAGHPYADISVASPTQRITDFMRMADLAITSGGRTVFELAALCIPMMVVCQNDRETLHSFAASENGIRNLGHQAGVTPHLLRAELLQIFDNPEERRAMIRPIIAWTSARDVRVSSTRFVKP